MTKTKLSKNEIDTIKAVSELMDSKFTLPVLNVKFGLDAIIGLIPFVGDSATALISSWMIHKAHKADVPFYIKAQMALNILIDWLIGSIPLLGDFFDIAWKANQRNAKIILNYIDKED